MNLGDLRSELEARGFNYLPSTRSNQWINDAYHEICEYADWPWLVTETTGTAPLTIADVREILYVLDTTDQIKLPSVDIRSITEGTTDLTSTGTPSTWYFTGNVLTLYPPNTTSSLSVRYLQVPDSLAADADEPIIPSRYHSLIADLASVTAYRDRDNYDAAAAQRQEVDRQLSRMATIELTREADNPQFMTITGASTDWGVYS